MPNQKEQMEQMGRLALRVEGTWWVAYFARPETMDDAAELGRIRMTLVMDKDRKAEFMALMQHCVTSIFKERGVIAEWPNKPVSAPEHERSGRS